MPTYKFLDDNGVKYLFAKIKEVSSLSTATTSANGLMSSTDKTRLDSMWNVWSADGSNDTLVNKVEEVLTAFNNFPEASTLVGVLATKVGTDSFNSTGITSALGLGSANTSSTWGTITSGNGYTIRWGADQAGGGGIVIGEKNGQTSIQVDGDIYVQEGGLKLATEAYVLYHSPTSLPASDVYPWAKEATKPGYYFSEIGRRYDTLITFDGDAPNIVGNVSAVGMAMSPEHGANRLAFINPAALYCEYSTDGENWSEMTSFNDSEKINLVTTNTAFPVGRSSGEYTVGSKSRITITGTNTSGTQYVYCSPKKMLINVSSSGGMVVKVEVRTGANALSNGSWSEYGLYVLSGWSGWNEIPLVLSTLGGGYTQTDNFWQLRLTFTMTTKNSSYPETAFINSIRLFADNAWYVTSGMASINHIYSYDIYQNAYFPNNIYENGTALTNKYLAKSGGTITGNLTVNGSIVGNAGGYIVGTDDTAFSFQAKTGFGYCNIIFYGGDGSCLGNLGFSSSKELQIYDRRSGVTRGWKDVALREDLSNYLPLSGGTLTGALSVHSTGSNRANINMISFADVPNDLYFGNNGSQKWSITSRDSGDNYDLWLYSTSKSIVATVSHSTGITNFYYRPTVGGTNVALTSDIPSLSGYVQSSSLGTAAYVNTGTSSGNVPVLNSNGKLSTSVIPDSVLHQLEYKGSWLAHTSTHLATDFKKGDYWICSKKGDYAPDGSTGTSWTVGDWAIVRSISGNTITWDKIDATNDVNSVNGQTGTVVLGASDVGALPTGGGAMTGTITGAQGGKGIVLQSTDSNGGSWSEGVYILDTAHNGYSTLTLGNSNKSDLLSIVHNGNTHKYYIDIVVSGDYKGYIDIPQRSGTFALTSDIPTIPSSLPANGGNADTVDGKHAGVNNGCVEQLVTFPNYNELINAGYLTSDYGTTNYGHPDDVFFQALCRWCIATYGGISDDNVLIGSVCPNSRGTVIINLYANSGTDNNGNPRYCSGVYIPLNGRNINFGFIDYTWFWKSECYASDYASNADTVDSCHVGRGSGDIPTYDSNRYLWSRGFSARLISSTAVGATYKGTGIEVTKADSGTLTTSTYTLSFPTSTTDQTIATESFVTSRGYLTSSDISTLTNNVNNILSVLNGTDSTKIDTIAEVYNFLDEYNSNTDLATLIGGKVDKTSTSRPGVTKLYRGDDDSGYYVQTDWDGTRWLLRGYANGSVHAQCRVGYADSAGNADTVDNEHASAFAHRSQDNDLIAHGNEFNFVYSGYTPTDVYVNYRTADGTGSATGITTYKLCDGKGGVLGDIIHSGNIGSQSVAYATSAGNAPANGGTSNEVWCQGKNGPDNAYVGGKFTPFYSWNNGGPVNSYAIGFTIGGHPSDPNYGWQMAQSLWDNDLYYRRYDAGNLGGFGGWNKVLNQSNGLAREAWWYDTETHSANDLGSGITFAYEMQHSNTATTGPLISFAGYGSSCESYRLQIQSCYTTPRLFFRNRNGDSGTWNNWAEVISSANISSQSVNYANSAGAVDWSNVANKPSTFSPSSHNHSGSDITSGTIADARLSSNMNSKLKYVGTWDASQSLALSGYTAAEGDMWKCTIGGNYDPGTAANTGNTWKTGDLAYYNGSAWITLIAGSGLVNNVKSINFNGTTLTPNVSGTVLIIHKYYMHKVELDFNSVADWIDICFIDTTPTARSTSDLLDYLVNHPNLISDSVFPFYSDNYTEEGIVTRPAVTKSGSTYYLRGNFWLPSKGCLYVSNITIEDCSETIIELGA